MMNEEPYSEEPISFAPLANDLLQLCESIKELIQTEYTFSISRLLSYVETIIKTSKKEEKEIEKLMIKYGPKCYYMRELLKALEVNISLYEAVIKAFRDSKLNKEALKHPINMVKHYFRLIYNNAIKVFVSVVREAGGIPADIFDSYNVFKRRWNKSLEVFEHRVSQYLPEVEDISKYIAPDLGVTIRTS